MLTSHYPHSVVLTLFLSVTLFSAGGDELFAAQKSGQTSEQEISHLLDFIENSECIFVRNNSPYDGKQARAHISRKYEYIKTRQKNISTEQFIEQAASQSSLTKKRYTVQCGSSAPIPSSQWLKTELLNYRTGS